MSSTEYDWTVSAEGRSNSSKLFKECETFVADRIGNSAWALVNRGPRAIAGLLVAQLAHVFGMVPTRLAERAGPGDGHGMTGGNAAEHPNAAPEADAPETEDTDDSPDPWPTLDNAELAESFSDLEPRRRAWLKKLFDGVERKATAARDSEWMATWSRVGKVAGTPFDVGRWLDELIAQHRRETEEAIRLAREQGASEAAAALRLSEDLCGILMHHCGEGGAGGPPGESAVECLRRVVAERKGWGDAVTMLGAERDTLRDHLKVETERARRAEADLAECRGALNEAARQHSEQRARGDRLQRELDAALVGVADLSRLRAEEQQARAAVEEELVRACDAIAQQETKAEEYREALGRAEQKLLFEGIELAACRKILARNTLVHEHVTEFHRAVGQPILTTPQVPAADRLKLRALLVAEEAFEFLEAMGAISAHSKARILDSIREDTLHTDSVDIVAVADALADIDYVVEGTRLEFGIQGAPIATLVHDANLAKAKGPVSPEGKRLKPAGWSPPDIASELRRQGWSPDP